MSTGNLIVAVTGGSGAIYAQRFLLQASRHYSQIYLLLSTQAKQVIAHELGLTPENWLIVRSAATLPGAECGRSGEFPSEPQPNFTRTSPERSDPSRQEEGTEAPEAGEDARAPIVLLDEKNYFTPPASGSFRHDGMVIVPCSMGTAGRIANGISNDLVTRSADVCLKEGRKLILVPREMPWNLIHLRNMTQLAEAGATILPACPAWYSNPQTLEDLADTVVARILQSLGIDQNLMKQWMIEES